MVPQNRPGPQPDGLRLFHLAVLEHPVGDEGEADQPDDQGNPAVVDPGRSGPADSDPDGGRGGDDLEHLRVEFLAVGPEPEHVGDDKDRQQQARRRDRADLERENRDGDGAGHRQAALRQADEDRGENRQQPEHRAFHGLPPIRGNHSGRDGPLAGPARPRYRGIARD